MLTRISSKHRITISPEIMNKMGLKAGDLLECYAENGNVVFEQTESDIPDQTYFNSPEWQEGETEASRDIEEGRYETFAKIEDLIDDLKKER